MELQKILNKIERAEQDANSTIFIKENIKKIEESVDAIDNFISRNGFLIHFNSYCSFLNFLKCGDKVPNVKIKVFDYSWSDGTKSHHPRFYDAMIIDEKDEESEKVTEWDIILTIHNPKNNTFKKVKLKDIPDSICNSIDRLITKNYDTNY